MTSAKAILRFQYPWASGIHTYFTKLIYNCQNMFSPSIGRKENLLTLSYEKDSLTLIELFAIGDMKLLTIGSRFNILLAHEHHLE